MPKKKQPSVFDCGLQNVEVMEYMGTWQSILARLDKPIDENELLNILWYEINGEEPRETVITRIHGRISRMRTQRERQELLDYVGVEG
jgi:hypothetical protein